MAVVLALITACCWGVADYLAGLASRREPVLTVVLVAQLVGFALLGVVVAARWDGALPAEDLAAAAVAGVFGVIALICLYQAMVLGTMSIIVPITATGAIIPVVAGVVGGDSLATVQYLGIVAAIVGVACATREREVEGSAPPPVAQRRAIVLAIIAAVAVGSHFVALDAASENDALSAVLHVRGLQLLILITAALIMRPRIQRAAIPGLAVIGVIDTSAHVMVAVALTLGMLSVVSVLTSLYAVVTVALAHIRLGERLARIQLVGVILALLGVALVTGGS